MHTQVVCHDSEAAAEDLARRLLQHGTEKTIDSDSGQVHFVLRLEETVVELRTTACAQLTTEVAGQGDAFILAVSPETPQINERIDALQVSFMRIDAPAAIN